MWQSFPKVESGQTCVLRPAEKRPARVDQCGCLKKKVVIADHRPFFDDEPSIFNFKPSSKSTCFHTAESKRPCEANNCAVFLPKVVLVIVLIQQCCVYPGQIKQRVTKSNKKSTLKLLGPKIQHCFVSTGTILNPSSLWIDQDFDAFLTPFRVIPIICHHVCYISTHGACTLVVFCASYMDRTVSDWRFQVDSDLVCDTCKAALDMVWPGLMGRATCFEQGKCSQHNVHRKCLTKSGVSWRVETKGFCILITTREKKGKLTSFPRPALQECVRSTLTRPK